MLETVYLADAILVRTVNGGATNTLQGARELRFETVETGIFGGEDNPANLNLDGILFDVTGGQDPGFSNEVEIEDTAFFELFFTLSGTPVSAIYAVLDIDDFNPDDAYAILVEGTPLPDLPIGTTLETFLAQNNGGFDENPVGFRANDVIEFTEFDDVEQLGAEPGSNGIDTETARGIAYLYEAAFGRVPDLGGLNFWINEFEKGIVNSLLDIAFEFKESAEFTLLFGDADVLSNQQYLDAVYGNILDRAPDPDGEAFYLNGLNDGRFTQETVLRDLSLSIENTESSRYILGLDELPTPEGPGVIDWVFA